MPTASLQFCPVSSQGQITLPKPVRAALKVKPGKDGVGFKIHSGKIELVSAKIREVPLRLSKAEIRKLDKLRKGPGKIFKTAEEFERYLASL